MDYEFFSEDEWEDEPDGDAEDLAGDEEEEGAADEDDDEDMEEFFVEDDYLSDDEGLFRSGSEKSDDEGPRGDGAKEEVPKETPGATGEGVKEGVPKEEGAEDAPKARKIRKRRLRQAPKVCHSSPVCDWTSHTAPTHSAASETLLT